ncbi:hypothetical protein BDN70DRAFT_379414 [Pholiota conissans]|uniref:Uncharacterized protein n=1 Tax=Pholiota conissans TaxID=109636 RepID=A0A9P5Z856_9AGAR|nr:hypothetical protein BDN70DRAFT_379414 [Pholiota conissans]
MFSKGNNAYDIVPTSSDLLSDTAPRSASSGDDFSATYGSLTQSPTDTRTETLRRERERMSREIADLETRSRTVGAVGSSTSGSSYAASSFMPPSTAQPGNSDLREQIAMLQEQIRQIEARQMHGTAEPPPEYDGPPPATGSGGGVVSAPSSSALLGDVKDPVA